MLVRPSSALVRFALGLLAAVQMMAAVPAVAQVQPLVADLSKHLVAITTGFAGTDVLLFGATDGPGDVILVVRGPIQTEVVRRKDKVAGVIWANSESVVFKNVPSYYRVASNRPVHELVGESTLERHQIGVESLELDVEGLDPDEDLSKFREALFRLKKEQGLYSYEPQEVRLLANRLFRAELEFPANVPTGTYMVEVYLVRDGQLAAAEITPLIISKAGIGAELFAFAVEHAALYGLVAIMLASLAGWTAGLAFRKS